MKKTKFVIVLIALLVILNNVVNIYGVNMPIDPGYDENNIVNTQVKNKVENIVGIFVYFVQIACIATMIFMGLRYMFASADIKADIKKNLIVWVVGAVFVFGATTIAGLILDIVIADKGHITITPVEGSSNDSELDNESDFETWSDEYWEKAEKAGIIPKYINNKDKKAIISRMDFAEIVYKLADKMDILTNGKNEEVDIADSGLTKSQKNKILKLYNNGIVIGSGKDVNGNVIFYPNESITREDVAVMMYRLLYNSGKINSTYITSGDRADTIYNEVSGYAKDAMIYMNKNKILIGDEYGNLNPKDNLTYEQAVTIAWRIYSGEE